MGKTCNYGIPIFLQLECLANYGIFIAVDVSYSRHVLPSICLFTNKQRFCEKQKILSALLLNFDHENLVLLVVWYHDHTIHMRLNGTICLDELIDEVLEFDGFDNMM